METTRLYINKGEAPLFFDIDLGTARAHDRINAPQKGDLIELIARRGTIVVPGGNREALEDLVHLAEDEKQSFYRVLFVEDDARVRACLGFGAVSGCDATYDCFGLVAEGQDWAAAALDAMVRWLGRAKVRVLRFEVDEANGAAARLALARGFAEEGRIPDFYRDGAGQRILVWRC